MRAYLDSLKAAGDLHVVSREVDPAHELAAVTAAFQKRHDGAILFEPGFYRDPHKDHWGRLGIDATKPRDREAAFERKAIPGGDGIDLANWLA